MNRIIYNLGLVFIVVLILVAIGVAKESIETGNLTTLGNEVLDVAEKIVSTVFDFVKESYLQIVEIVKGFVK
jgi:hypothetical protein